MEPVRAKKSLGQHFLRDDGVLRAIVSAAEITASDHVLEIGPGTGNMTELLARAAGRVTAMELDRSLMAALTARLAPYPGVTILQGDFLRKAPDLPAPYKVVANIPYYIATALLEALLERSPAPESITLLVQKDFALRLLSSPGGKEYGPLTLKAAYWGHGELLLDVPPQAFDPPPKVTSAVIRLTRGETPPGAESALRLAKTAFSQRRKQLVNALGGLGLSREALASLLNQAGVNPSRRPETLSPEEYLRLSHLITGKEEA